MNDFTPHITHFIDSILASVGYFKTELILAIGFLLCVFSSLFFDRKWKDSSFSIAMLTLIAALICNFLQYENLGTAFFDMLRIDTMALLSKTLILIGLLVTAIMIRQHFDKRETKKRKGDLYSILIGSSIGLLILVMTSNWLLAFIAIEMVSISSYILVGYFAEDKKQTEAAMKYALFGSACAAIMLYGLSLIYGFTGVLDFADGRHIQGLIDSPKVMSSIAILFMLTGIGFKLSFVPFHLWTPDVYEGAPTPITAFLSTVPKIAAIVLFARLAASYGTTLFYFSDIFVLFLSIVAVVSMLAGNLIALRQQNVKRMMAYSSIGHTGFLLMAVVGYMGGHQDTLLFYLFVYTLMNLAAFGFIDILEQQYGANEFADYTGMGKRMPIIFTLFSIVGISLIGLPPTAGFIGKLLVFSSIFEIFQQNQESTHLWLLIVGALTSVISLFYYFKIPLFAFLKHRAENESLIKPTISPTYAIAIILSILLLVFGIFPTIIINFFQQ
ncbi:NADH-quinone oxidoreductase subunit N [Sphingobacterium sp.]|uniref:NADH-quinone oxidoreductase subunit N n=1 Tax=Sphingobacterium sp. TaxID=341027 RepID=UPI0028A04342|nr:NADH-quinone oxidoreductase subunit N [Sphingobacterium sp.]